MRERLNICRDLHGLLLQFGRLAFVKQTGRAVREFCQLDRQQGETLTDIVMKLSGNPGSFLLLCVDQPAAQAGERLFRPGLAR